MAQRGKDTSDIIWVIVNSEDTQGKANATNAQGCRELCEARVDAQADMLYEQLSGQANELSEGDRIVMHQGGAKMLGGQRLFAAGYVRSNVQPLTPVHAHSLPILWEVTRRWYRNWPVTEADISGELIIFYDLKKAKSAFPSPAVIRPRPGDKFIPLHPDCKTHRRCVAYDQLNDFWHGVIQR